jgi:hypothetical protein
MLRYIFIALLYAACKDSSAPATRYLADAEQQLAKTIEQQCNPRNPHRYFMYEFDDSLPKEYRLFGRLRCSLRLPDGRFTGPLPLQLQGSTRYDVTGTCGIRIGPAPISAPLTLEVVLAWFEDRALADKLRDAVGQLDYSREYKVSLTAEGFHIYMEQHASMNELYMELVINGCDRSPTDERVFDVGEQLVFPGQESYRPAPLEAVDREREPLETSR